MTDDSALAPNSGKSWIKFLENRVGGILPCISDGMFPDYKMAAKTMLQYVFPVGTIILIETEDEEIRFAEVLTCIAKKLKVGFLDDKNERAIWIDLDSIITDNEEIESASKEASLTPKNEEKLCDIELFTKYKDRIHLKLYELIKEGDWIEVQSKKHPNYVYYSKVLENKGGILKITCETGTEYVHMFDPLVHHIGWALGQDTGLRKNDQSTKYSNFCKNVNYSEVDKNSAPEFLFRNNIVKPHNLKIGSMVAVSSEDCREFYFAHVNYVMNDHFFSVVAGDGYHINIGQNLFHIESQTIFPCDFMENVGIKPKQSYNFKKSINSWDDYREKYGRTSKNIFERVQNCGMIMKYENVEDINEIAANISTMRYVEWMDIIHNKLVVFGAEILRNDKGMLWIRLHHTNKLTIVHFTDTHILPCGFAAKHNIPIYYEDDEKLIVDPDIDRITPDITGISNGKDIFMPLHVDKDHFVPRLYIHKNCVVGPFLDSNLVDKLPSFYEKGSQKEMLNQIYRSLMCCVQSHKRHQVHQMFQNSLDNDKPNFLTPLIITKYRRNVNDSSQVLRAATCDNSEQMPAFVKALLRTIEACPHLMSFDDCPCSYSCLQEVKEHARKKRSCDAKRAAKIEKQKAKKNEEKEKLKTTPTIGEQPVSTNNTPTTVTAAALECEPSTSGTQILVNEIEEIAETSWNSGIGEKRKSSESIDDIVVDHSKSLLKKMEDAASNTKLLLTPLPPRSSTNTTPIAPAPSRIMKVPFPMSTYVKPTNISPNSCQLYPPPPPPQPIIPSHLHQQMAMMKMIPPHQRQRHSAFSQAMSGMPIPSSMSHFSPQMIMMMQQQLVAQHMAVQANMMQQHNPQLNVKTGVNKSPSTGIFPMQPTTSTSSSSSSSSKSASSGQVLGTKQDPIVVARPSRETVAGWTDEQLSDYLRHNLLNLGSDSIRILREGKISGQRLLAMDEEGCNLLMGQNRHGNTLFRFIKWVNGEF